MSALGDKLRERAARADELPPAYADGRVNRGCGIIVIDNRVIYFPIDAKPTDDADRLAMDIGLKLYQSTNMG